MSGVFEDHLTLDVTVAYADGEMGLTAYQRAAAHVTRCAECAAEVAEQTAARQLLRHASPPRMPGSLFDALKSIPVALPQDGPVPGIMMDTNSGRTIRTHDHPGQGRGRRFRLGAGALVAGIAVGAVVVAASGEHPAAPRTTPTRPEQSAVSRMSLMVPTRAVDVVARNTSTTR